MNMKCSWSGKSGLNTSLFAVIACLCAGPLDAGQTDVDGLGMTLCTAEEDVYFSCPLPGNKIVSVCASNNEAPGSGYVQYRYGTPDNMELLYPNKKAPPAGKFFWWTLRKEVLTKVSLNLRMVDIHICWRRHLLAI